jgi:hypothetical protein
MPTLAEKTKVEGVIVGRSGNVMIVEYTQKRGAGVSSRRQHEGAWPDKGLLSSALCTTPLRLV